MVNESLQTMKHRLASLEDFLVSSHLSVDAQLDDGWGATFPVKGREINASVLFADISGFSRRTKDLSSTETLIFVNNFFAWITAEALQDSHGIVDKYIGDEIMIVFSAEFGSSNPVAEALTAARRMAENDFLNYCPHIGIASGIVTVGYVGTQFRYNCSVFGAPVALAARCAAIKPDLATHGYCSSIIAFPAEAWNGQEFDELFPPKRFAHPTKGFIENPTTWKLLEQRALEMKNLGEVVVREAVNTAMFSPMETADQRARESLRVISENGRYWPNA